MSKYYIAYGSNLNIQQMSMRCPTAKVVGKTELKDWRLDFRGEPDNAVATIEPAEGGIVPVGIWRITNQDEMALDCYERYPTVYRKMTLNILLRGRMKKAMTYIMRENYPYNAPCFEYVRIIRDGYMAFGFNREILREAVAFARRYNHDRKD